MPIGADEVFIIDMVRAADGRRFVTSVSDPAEVPQSRVRYGAVTGQVSHWKRDGRSFRLSDYGSWPDWRLHKRFPL